MTQKKKASAAADLEGRQALQRFDISCFRPNIGTLALSVNLFYHKIFSLSIILSKSCKNLFANHAQTRKIAPASASGLAIRARMW
jgi:hypothetical protein